MILIVNNKSNLIRSSDTKDYNMIEFTHEEKTIIVHFSPFKYLQKTEDVLYDNWIR